MTPSLRARLTCRLFGHERPRIHAYPDPGGWLLDPREDQRP